MNLTRFQIDKLKNFQRARGCNQTFLGFMQGLSFSPSFFSFRLLGGLRQIPLQNAWSPGSV
jgi:hypothetical protein